MRIRFLAWLFCLLAVLPLTQCHPEGGGEQVGSETHFLRACPDGLCSEGDQCVCGVCTVACDSITACADRLKQDDIATAGLSLACRAPICSTTQDQQAAAAAVCDVACTTDADCKPLGDSYTCDQAADGGSCRSHAPVAAGDGQKNPCPGSMLPIPAGTLVDGAGVSHDIAAFCLDQTEVSVGNYTLCVNAMTPDCTAPAAGNYFVQGREGYPMNDVTLVQATAFCGALGARLPTSFEWQWAAQSGGAIYAYPWGNQAPTASDDPPRVCALAATADSCAVGGRAAGADSFGVTDLAGNVAELVTADTPCAAGGSYAATDPAALAASVCEPFTAAAVTIGFRCAADLP